MAAQSDIIVQTLEVLLCNEHAMGMLALDSTSIVLTAFTVLVSCGVFRTNESGQDEATLCDKNIIKPGK